jgi:CBS domain-containing protein
VYAIHRMNVGGFRHIPILDDEDKLVGVISIRGILAYLTERQLAKA